MSTRDRLVGDERGQSIVFVVLAMFALVSVLALVVDVGLWMRTQQKAQSVADAVALAAAQDLPSRTAASSTALTYTSRNGWSGSDVSWSFDDDDTTIEVVAERAAPGLFSRLVGVFNFTIGAEASARVEAPAALRNIAPLALECPDSCNPSALPGQQFTFRFRNEDPSTRAGENGFGPLDLPGLSSWNFDDYLECDPADPSPGDCWDDEVSVPGTFDLLEGSNFDAGDLYFDLRDAWNDGSWPRLVAIYDDYSSRREEYDVIGWAAFSITNVSRSVDDDGDTTVVRLTGTFRTLLVEGTGVSSDSSGAIDNFGVRAVALTH